MKNQVFFTLFLVAIIGACQSPKKEVVEEKTSPESDSLTADLQEIYQQGFINGFSVAVVNESGTIYQNGFGFANRELKKEFTENTIINIGSITKTVVGLSLMKTEELGLLKLDDPINNHLPFKVENPFFPKEQITIRQLANHTSTIIDSESFDETCYVLVNNPDTTKNSATEILPYFNSAEDTLSLSSFLESLVSEKGKLYSKEGFLKTKPGTEYSYSNTGAGLAALVVEKASGMPFGEFAKQHILQPLKMTSSGWKRSNLDINRISKNYATIDTAYADYHLINYPDGGLLATASDLGNLLTEMIKGYNGNGTLLSAESYQTIFATGLTENLFPEADEEVIPVISTRMDKGVFMALAPNNTIGHSGADPGIVGFMFFNSETGIGRILLVNMNIDNPNQGSFTELFDIWDKLGEYAEKL